MPVDESFGSGQNQLSSGSLDAAIPGADQFHRSHPAEVELTSDAIRISEQVVDFGCAIIVALNAINPERRIRDLVTMALLRRAVVTGEAICVLLRRGLAEPAFASHRTLLDIEVAMKLILRDDRDVMARRLALACALQYKSHGEDMLGNRPTREDRLGAPDRVLHVLSVTRSYANLIKDPAFDPVRDAVIADTHWHGFQNMEEAMRELGQQPDYFITYDAVSWFVHGVNIEHDLSASTDDQPALRPLVERDPSQVRMIMGLALLKLLELFGLFLKDRKTDIDALLGGHGKMRLETGDEHDIGSLMAVTTLVMREFDIREDAPFRPAP